MIIELNKFQDITLLNEINEGLFLLDCSAQNISLIFKELVEFGKSVKGWNLKKFKLKINKIIVINKIFKPTLSPVLSSKGL